MSSTLNTKEIENYAREFAEKILAGKPQKAYSGNDILNLSATEQVNVFVIKSLFEKWQASMEALKSPYFDFEHEKVQQALKSYMNTVSQYILVEAEHLKPLLSSAVSDTLKLCLAPQEYLQAELDKGQTTADTILKYSRVHHEFLQAAISAGTDAPAHTELSDTEPVLQSMAAVLPFAIEKFVTKETVETPASENTEPESSFFDKLHGRTSQVTQTPAVSKAEVVEKKSPVEIEKPKIKIKAEVTEKQEATLLHEQYLSTAPTMNDALRENSTSLADLHQHSPIKDLSATISLNQKFIFINQLFNGDSQAYQETLNVLGTCSNADEAINLLKYRYAPKYKWNLNSDEADELLDIVRRLG